MRRHVFIVLACGLFSVGLASPGSAVDGGTLYTRCVRCHGEDGTKKTDRMLKGQKSDALLGKLKGYAAGTYGGEKKNVMMNMVKDLSEADMEALAAHIAAFK